MREYYYVFPPIMCPTTHIIHMVKIDLVLFHSSSGLKITRLHETILGLSQHKLPTAPAPHHTTQSWGLVTSHLIHFSLQRWNDVSSPPTSLHLQSLQLNEKFIISARPCPALDIFDNNRALWGNLIWFTKTDIKTTLSPITSRDWIISQIGETTMIEFLLLN